LKKKVNPLDYFPLNVGSTWSYNSLYQTADKSTIEVKEKDKIKVKSLITERVSYIKINDDGVLAVIEGTVRKTVEYGSDVKEEDTRRFAADNNGKEEYIKYLFVYGNRIYELSDEDLDKTNYRPTSSAMHSIAGERMPYLFFPLTLGVRWADKKMEERDMEAGRLFHLGIGPAPNPGMYYKIVEGRAEIIVPAGKFEDVWVIFYRTAGGPSIKWFKEGVGILKEYNIHSGTYWEHEKVLIDYKLNAK